MEANQVKLLDVVALIVDQPGKGLARGQVGTVVEALGPSVFEIEFSDEAGATYAQAAVDSKDLLVLHYHPRAAA